MFRIGWLSTLLLLLATTASRADNNIVQHMQANLIACSSPEAVLRQVEKMTPSGIHTLENSCTLLLRPPWMLFGGPIVDIDIGETRIVTYRLILTQNGNTLYVIHTIIPVCCRI